MRIIMVSTYYTPYCSGVTEYVRRLAEALVKKGHDVTVLTSRFDRTLPQQERHHGVQILRERVLFRFSKGVCMPLFVRHAWRHAGKHDIVNIHLPMMEAGMIALGIPQEKLVTTYHCDLTLKGAAGMALERLYYLSATAALRKSMAVVTYTKDYAQHSILLQRFLRKTTCIFPPIDAAAFRFKKNNLRKKLGIGSRQKVVGFAGRLVYEKGLPFLLDAWPRILQRHPNARLLLAGEHERVAGGSVLRQLRQLRKHDNSVTLLGNLSQKELPAFYSACDVLVLPSIDRLEAFGIVQVEAMLCGTPVVATDMPGVRVPVQRTGMGRLVQKRNSEELAAAVLDVLANKKSRIGTHHQVARTFAMQNTIQTYEKIFNQPLRKKQHG